MECRCHISACNIVLDAISSLLILCFVMQNRISPAVYLLSLCDPFYNTFSQFFTPKINLVISRTVTKVVVWMKTLTRISTWRTNLQGSFLDIPKIEQCTIFFWYTKNWTMRKLCVIVSRFFYWWSSWFPLPRIWQGIQYI